MKNKFAVIHYGARLHYAVPSVLAEAGLLQMLYADATSLVLDSPLFQLWPKRLRPGAINRLGARRLPDTIPASAVKSYLWPNIQQRFFELLAGRRRKSARLEQRWRAGCHALGHLAINDGFGGATTLYTHPCCATDAILEAKRRGMKVVLEAISHPFNAQVEKEEYERFNVPLPYDWAEALDNIQFFKAEAEQADLVLAASPYVRGGLIELGLPESRIKVVPYGFNASQFSDAPQPVTGRALFVGNVRYLKGNPYLAEAARLLADQKAKVDVRVVGPYETSLLDRPEFKGPHYVGQVSRSEIKREFLAADFFVLPTLSDGFGIVLLEGLAAGLPVICTPNCASVVEDGKNGFIVPIRDAKALADRMRLLTEDRRLRAEMSVNARAAATEFTLQKYGKRLVEALV